MDPNPEIVPHVCYQKTMIHLKFSVAKQYDFLKYTFYANSQVKSLKVRTTGMVSNNDTLNTI